jgi:hypothetical protein
VTGRWARRGVATSEELIEAFREALSGIEPGNLRD